MTMQRLGRSSDARLRAPRFESDGDDLLVESKTIGTDVTYKLMTGNFSRSGLLLEWQHQSKMPFIVNTILELKIDPKGSVLDAPVLCLGKVVRRKEVGKDQIGFLGTQIGVQIIQMDTDDLTLWEKCLALVEKRLAALALPEVPQAA